VKVTICPPEQNDIESAVGHVAGSFSEHVPLPAVPEPPPVPAAVPPVPPEPDALPPFAEPDVLPLEPPLPPFEVVPPLLPPLPPLAGTELPPDPFIVPLEPPRTAPLFGSSTHVLLSQMRPSRQSESFEQPLSSLAGVEEQP
jgi:hypothetical protein